MNELVLSPRHKAGLLTSLYFAQGLPFGFFAITLPVLLREAGVSLTAIGALGLLYLPWALKFLWAPYLDHCASPRRWLLLFQSAAALLALALMLVRIDSDLGIVMFAAFVFSALSASQDVVTDGLAGRILHGSDRAVANAIQVGAYRLGMIFGGGVLLWVFARSSWSTMFACMAALLLAAIPSVLLMSDHVGRRLDDGPSRRQLPVLWLKRLLLPEHLAFAGLIVCYRLGDAVVSSLIGPFLTDSGLSIETIALMRGSVGSATALLGAALGGWYAYRCSRRRVVLITGLAQAVTFMGYLHAALVGGSPGLFWAVTIAEGIIGTMATVALFTLMMDASDPEHAGTDYTLFASIVVLVGTAGGFFAGLIGDALGYAAAFMVGIVTTAVGCLTLVRCLDKHWSHPRLAAVWSARPVRDGGSAERCAVVE